jgi:hypothetical protein
MPDPNAQYQDDKGSIASLKIHPVVSTEHNDDGNDHLAVRLPPSLEGLSEEERAEVAKRATRKIDIMLIPARTCS